MPGRFRKAPVVISHKLISKIVAASTEEIPETELLYPGDQKRQMGVPRGLWLSWYWRRWSGYSAHASHGQTGFAV